MRSLDELNESLMGGPPGESQAALEQIVLRLGGGVHRVVEAATITVDRGLLGDRWSEAEAPDRDQQVTLMNTRVAATVCDGQPLHLPGDNLFADLDLSEDRLPAGARIAVGAEVVLEVSDEPHTGCRKFMERFGAPALRWVNTRAGRALRLRGVNCRVVRGGKVAVGDRVRPLGAAGGVT